MEPKIGKIKGFKELYSNQKNISNIKIQDELNSSWPQYVLKISFLISTSDPIDMPVETFQ